MATRNLAEAAEIWYQRTHHMREVAERAEDPTYKARAEALFYKMVQRMMGVTKLYSDHKLRTTPPPSFPSGGHVHR